MKLIGRSILGVASLGAFISLTAASANAQQASFTLPMEAHWAGAVLEPGNYIAHFPSAADPLRVIRISGNDKTMLFVPMVTSNQQTAQDNGKLILANVNGEYSVQSISDPINARDFTFNLPKRDGVATGTLKHQNSARIAVKVNTVSK